VSTFFTGITGIPFYLLFRESFTGGKQSTVLIGLLLVLTGFWTWQSWAWSRDSRYSLVYPGQELP
ncbi:hypothetical protein, partial [Methanothrix sp.]|uniref:hypothetical protein n=1 Tax=Methanothrix sp. TaxID=90426 RepID=UPI0032993A18